MSVNFTIRPIANYDEYIAVAALQKMVWGPESIEIVPPSILMVNAKIGGIVAGAFTPENELVAFVYGLPGFREGKEVHWSHMLAVKPGWRGNGLGRRLKHYQREFVLQKDIDVMHWTYDPLESVNAMLNLDDLGALPMEYALNLYGKGEESILHKGIGTDRFIVTWFMKPEMRTAHLARYHSTNDTLSTPAVITPDLTFSPVDAPVVRVEIPAHIQQVKAKAPAQAPLWRAATRAAFLHYFEAGYTVIACVSDEVADRYFYVMAAPI